MKGYKILIAKRYFDKGKSVTHYFNWVIVFFGVSSRNIELTFIIAFIYGIFCYFFGRWWHMAGLENTEIEISNQFNPFIKEVRQKI